MTPRPQALSAVVEAPQALGQFLSRSSARFGLKDSAQGYRMLQLLQARIWQSEQTRFASLPGYLGLCIRIGHHLPAFTGIPAFLSSQKGHLQGFCGEGTWRAEAGTFAPPLFSPAHRVYNKDTIGRGTGSTHCGHS